MEYSKALKDKTILITGGTGSFGNAVVKKLLDFEPKKIIIFSRDEKKQFDMGNKFNNDKLKFVVGDVRSKDSIMHAMYGVDYVFHAAAMKQVPGCEFFPMEALKTNCIGTHNVIDAAIFNNVKRVVVLSTDKAVHPVNAMGITKSMMEKIMIAASREKRGDTVLCGTRYGNVMYTRGSVMPYFVNLMKQNKPITVTNGKMTRFMMSLDESIDLVFYALVNGENGEIYTRKAPASTVADLAEVMTDIFDYQGEIKEIGLRPGEKIHETLVSVEEIPRTIDCGDYYRTIAESPDMDYRDYHFVGQDSDNTFEDGITSANTRRLTKNELKELILSLEEVQDELKEWKHAE